MRTAELIGGEIVYRDMTQSEVDAIKAENQRKLLEQLTKDTVSNADLIEIILSQYTVNLPNGESKPVSEVVNQHIDLPFKLGYKWEMVLNGNTFAYQLVEDENAIGTADNPIYFYDGCPLVNGGFYIKDGGTFVYMDGQWIEW